MWVLHARHEVLPVRMDQANAEDGNERQMTDADTDGVRLLYKVAEAAKALVEQSGVVRYGAANGALWRELQEALDAIYGATPTRCRAVTMDTRWAVEFGEDGNCNLCNASTNAWFSGRGITNICEDCARTTDDRGAWYDTAGTP
jgi:hypothetical protein